MSIFDLRYPSLIGVLWLGYGTGLTISQWVTGAIFIGAGLFLVLVGEGLLTWKRRG